MRSFHNSPITKTIDIPAEQKCREILDQLPDIDHLFENEDGTKRVPSEEELKKIAFLNTYAGKRTLSLIELLFKFPKEYEDLYLENDTDLNRLKASSGLIIDKVPYEDTSTGEIKWQVIREGDEKEGWENIVHFTFIPACVLLVVALIWREDMDVTEWAKRELLFRVKEKAVEEGDTEALEAFDKYGGNPEAYDFKLAEFGKNDDVIVERILRGDYDRLARLKVNQNSIKSAVEPST
ncbi:hypothetical protein CANARDRAFT_199070 [[Candida] arabinofermentans NRRL YB-2248]|uniref:NADH dehydrogenase [ubiquinone] 1 beta subcomplex subunit 11, mitochondrial n=1 Tax=[Candida] arabinofermentans NRRL YB-2248 TaxID=983967 RepID=A0A1E4T025_9ASCO|nr:hypothetical protein CANARDRAFT_199070 [[Candida] arabinofermentans NRRL YB-2248]